MLYPLATSVMFRLDIAVHIFVSSFCFLLPEKHNEYTPHEIEPLSNTIFSLFRLLLWLAYLLDPLYPNSPTLSHPRVVWEAASSESVG